MEHRLTDTAAPAANISNAELISAICRLADEPNDENRVEFVDKLLSSTLLVPLALEVPPAKPEETIICTDTEPLAEIRDGFPISCILCEDNSLVFPAFSDRDALSKFSDERTVCLVVTAEELLKYFLRYSAETLAINPMSEASVQIAREEIAKILAMKSAVQRPRSSS